MQVYLVFNIADLESRSHKYTLENLTCGHIVFFCHIIRALGGGQITPCAVTCDMPCKGDVCHLISYNYLYLCKCSDSKNSADKIA